MEFIIFLSQGFLTLSRGTDQKLLTLEDGILLLGKPMVLLNSWIMKLKIVISDFPFHTASWFDDLESSPSLEITSGDLSPLFSEFSPSPLSKF